MNAMIGTDSYVWIIPDSFCFKLSWKVICICDAPSRALMPLTFYQLEVKSNSISIEINLWM
jgi:hypothetical protein